MAEYIFPPSNINDVMVYGSSARFPVRRIFCVAQNYAAHSREMGVEPNREPLSIFCKPSDSIVPNGSVIRYPSKTKNLHHEVELVVAIGKTATDISTEHALEVVFGYAVGLDLTRRDLQITAKQKGQPWDVSKAFDDSAPISSIHPVENVGHPTKGAIWLEINGKERQRGDLSELIWSIPDVISHISNYFRLMPGDLLFTGTPKGVGPIVPGDRLKGAVEGIDELFISIQ